MATLANLKTLLIPHKTSSKQGQPEYGDDMRAIETWANNLPRGAYASLTGPGETTTPGALTQEGPFTVDDTTTPTASVGVDIVTTGQAYFIGFGFCQIGSDDTTGTVQITAHKVIVGYGDSTAELGFYGNSSPVIQPHITGSRGGNAALASLLTALDSQGLIVDMTSA